MKMKKLLLVTVLAASAAACSADVTAPELRTPGEARLNTATTTAAEPDSTITPRETGLIGPGGG